MVLEKSINVIGLFFVNSYMAKYIGADNFGKIAFATSLFLFIQTFSWLGMENILFKRMSINPLSGVFLGTQTGPLRIKVLLISSGIALLYLLLYTDTITFAFGVANFFASYYLVRDIYTTYNNSQLNSHINVITNIAGLSAALTIRAIIAYLALPIYWFILPIVLIPMIPYLLRKRYFLKSTPKKIRYKKKYGKHYNEFAIKTGGALLLSTLSITFYTQISGILLAKLISYEALGIYSVTLTVASGIGIITQALTTSFFSKIYEENDIQKSEKYIYQINMLIIVVSFIAILGYTIIGKDLVLLLYGEQYKESLFLIPYAMIGMIFSALGAVGYRYMIKENGYIYLSIKMLLISILSLPVSYFSIRFFGIFGALICFIFIEFFSCTIANYFFKNGLMFKLHRKSFLYLFQSMRELFNRV